MEQYYSKQQSRVNMFSAKLKQNATSAELIFKQRLDDLGIRYMFQKGFVAGELSCIVDFYLPKPYKLCIEIDGGYHDNPKQRVKDAWRTKYLTEYRGFKELRIRNEDAATFDIEKFLLDLQPCNVSARKKEKK